jgi:hypothetical protein
MASSAEPAGTRQSATGIRGADWVVAGCAILSFAGILNVIDGALAVGGSRVYANHAVFVFSDLNTWGWIVLALGVVLIAAARGVLQGSEFWRWFGVAAASVNALAQLLFAQAYPLWSITVFALDVIVVYALSVHAGSKLTAP